jgi:hypothetical protein
VTGVAVHPVARGLLVWMQAGGPRLQSLMAEEAARADDLSPAGDAAVRAQLRFLAEALAANAGPGRAAALEAFRDRLPDVLDDAEDRLRAHAELLGEATAFEVGLQFADASPDDPGLVAMLERRVRVGAWVRLFLEAFDAAQPDRPPAAPAALAWMADHQVHLADTIFSMDRRAKQLAQQRGGPEAIADQEVVNRIGQATMLQSHVRFLVEALARAM